MNKVLLEQLKDYQSLFMFTILGIDYHLRNDEPDPNKISAALSLLDGQLSGIINDLSRSGEKEKSLPELFAE